MTTDPAARRAPRLDLTDREWTLWTIAALATTWAVAWLALAPAPDDHTPVASAAPTPAAREPAMRAPAAVATTRPAPRPRLRTRSS